MHGYGIPDARRRLLGTMTRRHHLHSLELNTLALAWCILRATSYSLLLLPTTLACQHGLSTV